MTTGPSPEAIERARELLAGVAIRTPIEGARWLSTLAGGPVLLKAENLQRAGSFKIRGAYTRMSGLTPEELARALELDPQFAMAMVGLARNSDKARSARR